ncbi:MAG: amidohydrolase family protein [Proteobacteria bacterium]|nr:amidohydrolase family protein [Pseudomonadota bacterium]
MARHEPYDAVIVGSGAGGGMAAWVLASKGLRVLMLEAGRHYDPYAETPMFSAPRDAPLRGASTPDKAFGYYDACVDGGWEVPGEPYASAPGSEFMWWRSRMLGGRTNHWARNSFRMGPYDFKPPTRDGLGVDWPVRYEDLAPYYDKTEAIVGVYGRNDGLENHPDSSPGVLHQPPAPRVGELLIQAGCHDLDIPCVPARRAVLTRPIGNRSACFYATNCGRGCSIGAAFQTTTSFLPMALATDCNPGSAPVTSLLLMLNMGCTLFGLTPEEAFSGVTRHGARALGLGASHGTLEAGKAADFAVWDIARPAELAYRLGFNPLAYAVKDGIIGDN